MVTALRWERSMCDVKMATHKCHMCAAWWSVKIAIWIIMVDGCISSIGSCKYHNNHCNPLRPHIQSMKASSVLMWHDDGGSLKRYGQQHLAVGRRCFFSSCQTTFHPLLELCSRRLLFCLLLAWQQQRIIVVVVVVVVVKLDQSSASGIHSPAFVVWPGGDVERQAAVQLPVGLPFLARSCAPRTRCQS
jgi:hypothetical protein